MFDPQLVDLSEAIRSAKYASNTLISISVPWQRLFPLELVMHVDSDSRWYWGQSDLQFGGIGTAATLTANGDGRFREIEAQAKVLFENSVSLSADSPVWAGPHLVGGFSFISDDTFDPFWETFGEAYFILPEVQLTTKGGQTWLTLNKITQSKEDPEQVETWFQGKLKWLTDFVAPENVVHLPEILVETLLDITSWKTMITEAVEKIKAGEMDKVVLSRPVKLSAEGSIDISSALDTLDERYPDTYRFLFEPQPGKALLGATPELLASVEECSFLTVALAGSIGRGSTEKEDERLGQVLLHSDKDWREHDLVVQALRERLLPLTTSLNIEAQPHLRQLKNIQHLESHLDGQLKHGATALSLVSVLHPTPALGGVPREDALPYIQQVEPFSRGWYAAPIGWVGPNGDGTFAVGIRSAVIDHNQAVLYAGCGIVADSEPEKEWQETELKLQPLLEALGGQNG